MQMKCFNSCVEIQIRKRFRSNKIKVNHGKRNNSNQPKSCNLYPKSMLHSSLKSVFFYFISNNSFSTNRALRLSSCSSPLSLNPLFNLPAVDYKSFEYQGHKAAIIITNEILFNNPSFKTSGFLSSASHKKPALALLYRLPSFLNRIVPLDHFNNINDWNLFLNDVTVGWDMNALSSNDAFNLLKLLFVAHINCKNNNSKLDIKLFWVSYIHILAWSHSNSSKSQNKCIKSIHFQHSPIIDQEMTDILLDHFLPILDCLDREKKSAFFNNLFGLLSEICVADDGKTLFHLIDVYQAQPDLSRSVESWNKLFFNALLVGKNYPQRVFTMLFYMCIKDNIPFNDYFNSLLSFLKSSNLQDRFVDHILKKKEKKSQAFFDMLMSSLIHYGDLEKAIEMIEFSLFNAQSPSQRPSTKAFSDVLQILLSSPSKKDIALQLIRDGIDREIPIQVIANLGPKKYARYKYAFNIMIFERIVVGLFQGGFIQQAQKLFDSYWEYGLESPTKYMYNGLVTGLLQHGKLHLAFNYLEEMKESAIPMHPYLKYNLIKCLVQNGRREEAETLFANIIEHEGAKYGVFYELVPAYQFFIPGLTTIDEVLLHMKSNNLKPSATFFNNWIRFVLDHKDSEIQLSQARSTFALMKQHDIIPNGHSYGMMIRAELASGFDSLALEWYADFLQNTLVPNMKILTMLSQRWIKKRNFEQGLLWFGQMIGYLITNRNNKWHIEVDRRSTSSGIDTNAVVFIFSELCLQNRPDIIWALVSKTGSVVLSKLVRRPTAFFSTLRFLINNGYPYAIILGLALVNAKEFQELAVLVRSASSCKVLETNFKLYLEREAQTVLVSSTLPLIAKQACIVLKLLESGNTDPRLRLAISDLCGSLREMNFVGTKVPGQILSQSVPLEELNAVPERRNMLATAKESDSNPVSRVSSSSVMDKSTEDRIRGYCISGEKEKAIMAIVELNHLSWNIYEIIMFEDLIIPNLNSPSKIIDGMKGSNLNPSISLLARWYAFETSRKRKHSAASILSIGEKMFSLSSLYRKLVSKLCLLDLTGEAGRIMNKMSSKNIGIDFKCYDEMITSFLRQKNFPKAIEYFGILFGYDFDKRVSIVVPESLNASSWVQLRNTIRKMIIGIYDSRGSGNYGGLNFLRDFYIQAAKRDLAPKGELLAKIVYCSLAHEQLWAIPLIPYTGDQEYQQYLFRLGLVAAKNQLPFIPRKVAISFIERLKCQTQLELYWTCQEFLFQSDNASKDEAMAVMLLLEMVRLQIGEPGTIMMEQLTRNVGQVLDEVLYRYSMQFMIFPSFPNPKGRILTKDCGTVQYVKRTRFYTLFQSMAVADKHQTIESSELGRSSNSLQLFPPIIADGLPKPATFTTILDETLPFMGNALWAWRKYVKEGSFEELRKGSAPAVKPFSISFRQRYAMSLVQSCADKMNISEVIKLNPDLKEELQWVAKQMQL